MQRVSSLEQIFNNEQLLNAKGKGFETSVFGGLFDNLDMWDPLLSHAAPAAAPFSFEEDAVVPSFTDLDTFEVPNFGTTEFLIPFDDEIPLVPELFAAPTQPAPAAAVAPRPLVPSQPEALHRTIEAKVSKPKPRRSDAPRARHHSRKAFADGRPRIKGRFARKEEVEAYMAEMQQEQGRPVEATIPSAAAAPVVPFQRAASEEVSVGSVNDHVVPQGF